MHGAQRFGGGLCFCLGMNAGKFGFPNELEDDPILRLVMPQKENFEFAEERRLFYVALTRAKQKVYLLARQDRPSSFIEEIVQMTALER